jgi:hypothetical protein
MQPEQLAYAIVTPYSIRKSRTGGILGRLISRTGLDLVGGRMFAPGAVLTKRYADTIVTETDPSHRAIARIFASAPCSYSRHECCFVAHGAVHTILSLRCGEQNRQNPPHMKTNTLSVILILLFSHFAPLHTAQAVSPPPDGGYPGGNTAEGQSALFSLDTTVGSYNTAVGFLSLRSNAFGSFNTGIGAGTLALNTAEENTATGTGALLFNTTGFQNTANGAFALFSNTEGYENTAAGVNALLSNTTGAGNTATGVVALLSNTIGNGNTAIGLEALRDNTEGNQNTATGTDALLSRRQLQYC